MPAGEGVLRMLLLLAIENASQRGLLLEMYDMYWGALCRFAGSILRDSAAAEDVVQEVFLKLAARPELLRYDAPEQNKAYLMMMTRNRAYNALRQRDREYAEPEITGAADGGIDELFFRLEPLAEVENIHPGLLEAEKELLLLRYVFNQTDEQIGEALGISAREVQRRASRLRQKIKARRDAK